MLDLQLQPSIGLAIEIKVRISTPSQLLLKWAVIYNVGLLMRFEFYCLKCFRALVNSDF